MAALGTALLWLVCATTFASMSGMTFGGIMVQVIAACAGAAVGALFPRAGTFLAYGALSLTYLLNNSPALGAILLIATALWWYYTGREDSASSNGGLTFPLAGTCWLGPITPLVAGMIERPTHALGTTAFSLVIALALAGSWSSGVDLAARTTLTMWPLGHLAVYGVPAIAQAELLTFLSQPTVWITALSWLIAAFVFAFFRNWYGRGFAYIGAVFATAVLIAGIAGGALISSMPIPVAPLVSVCVAGVITIFAANLIPDEIEEDVEEPVEEDTRDLDD